MSQNAQKIKLNILYLADMMKYTEHEKQYRWKRIIFINRWFEDKKDRVFSIFTIDSSFQNVIKYKNYNDFALWFKKT